MYEYILKEQDTWNGHSYTLELHLLVFIFLCLSSLFLGFVWGIYYCFDVRAQITIGLLHIEQLQGQTIHFWLQLQDFEISTDYQTLSLYILTEFFSFSCF